MISKNYKCVRCGRETYDEFEFSNKNLIATYSSRKVITDVYEVNKINVPACEGCKREFKKWDKYYGQEGWITRIVAAIMVISCVAAFLSIAFGLLSLIFPAPGMNILHFIPATLTFFIIDLIITFFFRKKVNSKPNAIPKYMNFNYEGDLPICEVRSQGLGYWLPLKEWIVKSMIPIRQLLGHKYKEARNLIMNLEEKYEFVYLDDIMKSLKLEERHIRKIIQEMIQNKELQSAELIGERLIFSSHTDAGLDMIRDYWRNYSEMLDTEKGELPIYRRNLKTILILTLDFIIIIIFILCMILPFWEEYYLGFMFYFVLLISGGLPIIIFISLLLSIVFTYQQRPRTALLLKGISFSIIFGVIFLLFVIIYNTRYYFHIGSLLFIINEFILLLSFILELLWRNLMVETDDDAIGNYIKSLLVKSDFVTLSDIAKRLKLNRKSVKEIIEKMNFKEHPKHFELIGERLILTSEVQSESVRDGKDFVMMIDFASKLYSYRKKAKKRIIIIIIFNLFILFFISFSLIFNFSFSSFLPLPPYRDSIGLLISLGLILFIGIPITIISILISIVFNYKYKPGRALLFKAICLILFSIFLIFLFFHSTLLSNILGFFNLSIVSFLIHISLIFEATYQKSISDYKYELEKKKVKTIIKPLVKKYNFVGLSSIENALKLNVKNLKRVIKKMKENEELQTIELIETVLVSKDVGIDMYPYYRAQNFKRIENEKGRNFFDEKNQKTLIIFFLDILVVQIFILSLFLPFFCFTIYSINVCMYGWELYLFNLIGIGETPIVAYVLIIWSIYFTYKKNIKRALIIKGISFTIIITLIIYPFTFLFLPNFVVSIGIIIFIINGINFHVSIVLEAIWRKSIMESKNREIKNYIKNLHERYDFVYLSDIAKKLKSNKDKIKKVIEKMNNKEGLEQAELLGDRLILTSGNQTKNIRDWKQLFKMIDEAKKLRSFRKKERKRIKKIIILDILVLTLMVLSSIINLLYVNSYLTNQGYSKGLIYMNLILFVGIPVNIICILFSIFFTYKNYFRRATVLKGIGFGLFFNLLMFLILTSLYYFNSLGLVALIINGFTLLFSILLEIIWEESILENKFEELRYYLFILRENYNFMDIFDIAKSLELKERHIPKIKNKIKNMIYTRELPSAKLIGNTLVFKSGIQAGVDEYYENLLYKSDTTTPDEKVPSHSHAIQKGINSLPKKTQYKLLVIIIIDIIIFVLFIVPTFLPIGLKTSEYFTFYYMGSIFYFSWIILGGVPMFAFISLILSIFFTYQVKIGKALILKGVSFGFFSVMMMMLIILLLSFNIQIGSIVYIIGEILLFLSFILENVWRQGILENIYIILSNHIKNLSQKYDFLVISDLAKNLEVKEKYIKNGIEQMIDNNEIPFTELVEDKLIFSSHSKSELDINNQKQFVEMVPKQEETKILQKINRDPVHNEITAH